MGLIAGVRGPVPTPVIRHDEQAVIPAGKAVLIIIERTAPERGGGPADSLVPGVSPIRGPQGSTASPHAPAIEGVPELYPVEELVPIAVLALPGGSAVCGMKDDSRSSLRVPASPALSPAYEADPIQGHLSGAVLCDPQRPPVGSAGDGAIGCRESCLLGSKIPIPSGPPRILPEIVSPLSQRFGGGVGGGIGSPNW